MNDTTINISGITIVHHIIDMEDSTDTANVLIIKDERGAEVRVEILFGNINKVYEKNCSSKRKQ